MVVVLGHGDTTEELYESARYERDTLRSARDDFGYKPGTSVDTSFKKAQPELSPMP